MKKLLAVGVAMAFGAVAQAETLDVSNFRYKSEISFSGYAGTTTLSGFPALVKVSAIPGFDKSQLSDGANDFRFADAAGNLIPHEVDTFTDEEILVWVRVPELAPPADAPTTVTVYWGAKASPQAVTATDVWTGYTGVWHLNEASGNAVDSALGDGTLDAVPKGDPASDAGCRPGAVGSSRNCAKAVNTNNHGFEIPSCQALKNLGTAFTFSGWLRNQATNGGEMWIVRRMDISTSTYGWGIQTGSYAVHHYRPYGSDNTKFAKDLPGPSTYGDWAFLTVVFNGKQATVYADGVPLSQGTTSFAQGELSASVENDIDSPLGFSYTPGGSARSWWGAIDEFRLIAGERSADAIAADSETVKHNDTFTTYGRAVLMDVGTAPEALFDAPKSKNGYRSKFSGRIVSVGADAATADVMLAFAPQGEELPEATAVRSGLADGAAWTYEANGLVPGTTYAYSIFVRNDQGESTTPISGVFTLASETLVCSGGAMDIQGDYRVHTFRSNGTFNVSGEGTAEILIVAGGGGGGVGSGGGGGGGGVIYREAFPLAAGAYDIVVGDGGKGALGTYYTGQAKLQDSTQGGNSSAFGLEAIGGGRGGSGNNGGAGGSGGGSGGLYHQRESSRMAGVGTDGQGHKGGESTAYQGGGGGGAGEVGGSLFVSGQDFRYGGRGLKCDISGRDEYYGGGGNGGYFYLSRDGSGGRAFKAGYTGAPAAGSYGEKGLDGYGMGGGGGGFQTTKEGDFGGDGGSGCVIIRYRAAGDVAYRTDIRTALGGDEVRKIRVDKKPWMVHTFLSNGTFTVPGRARVQVLAVGGGGAGGVGEVNNGGGGGGGVLVLSNLVVEAGTYDIVIGQGAVHSNGWPLVYANGGDTKVFGYCVPGGATGGGKNGDNPTLGASGGGGTALNTGSLTVFAGIARSGWGYAGGYGQSSGGGGRAGGGGGAGGPGGDGSLASNRSYGGIGVMCDFSGEEKWYGGGGGGGIQWGNNSIGVGGQGGGGHGAWCSKQADGTTICHYAESGTPGTGGGGGGATGGLPSNGAGGSGIVIVRYELTPDGLMLLLK